MSGHSKTGGHIDKYADGQDDTDIAPKQPSYRTGDHRGTPKRHEEKAGGQDQQAGHYHNVGTNMAGLANR